MGTRKSPFSIWYAIMTVIILAAGFSSRMGCNKLLLPFNGKTILSASIENALSFTSSVIMVTGHESEKTESIASGYGVRTVYAKHYRIGQMASSIEGISASGDDDFAIVPGDLPLIKREDYIKGLEMLHEAEIVRPVFNGNPGHPVMYRKSLKEELLAFDGTMKEFLAIHDTKLYEGSIGTVFDADTPERYAKLLAMHSAE